MCNNFEKSKGLYNTLTLRMLYVFPKSVPRVKRVKEKTIFAFKQRTPVKNTNN